MQLEVADEDRVRGDFALSGPLSADAGLYYALSGFYRYGRRPDQDRQRHRRLPAPRQPQEGVRGRLRLDHACTRSTSTTRRSSTCRCRSTARSRKRIRGNDGDEVEQVETDQVDGMSYNVPGGVFSSSIGDGVVTKDGSVGIAFEKDLGNDWGVNGKARYASYDHVFDFFLDGDGRRLNVPETQAAFIAYRNANTRPAGVRAANGTFTYADTGEVCRPTACCSRTASSIATGRPTT